MGEVRLLIRHEVRPTEHRAPVVPADARRLVEHGIAVSVEDSPQRVFPLSEYARAGCRTAPAGSWVGASTEEYVIGLKELPPSPLALRQRHIFFGHAYKRQDGAADLLRRFVSGGGTLLDVEYLVDADGRRLAAFGYWAGYVGAALGLLRLYRRLAAPLASASKDSLDRRLRKLRRPGPPRVLVVGALGRCGRGARDALATAGIAPTCWDLPETRGLDRSAVLGHDLLVNAVGTTQPVPPLLAAADLDDPGRRLRVVVDVSCDVSSDCNMLPIYDRGTDWQQPVRRLRDGTPPLDLIAIDNLPSLLPAEASTAFSAELVPHLLTLGSGAPAWQRCVHAFHQACRAAGVTGS